MTAENKPLPAIPAKRYFTIGEVSELCGVKAYVLRYWEQEFTQLKPMKRRGNRRYYQHHEVLLIRRIRDLLYEQGFTISGARNQLVDAGIHAHVARDDADDAGPLGHDDGSEDDTAPGLRATQRDPAARTRAGDASLGANARTTASSAVTSASTDATESLATGQAAGALDASALDDAALDALARNDLATIEQAGRERGDAEMLAAAGADRAAFAGNGGLGGNGGAAGARAAATGARSAALQFRKSAGNASTTSLSDASCGPDQIRAELLAIRALLVS